MRTKELQTMKPLLTLLLCGVAMVWSWEGSAGASSTMVVCAPNCSGKAEGSRIPDPSNCYRYYICSQAETNSTIIPSDTPIDCPDGMYFDQTAHVCKVATSGTYCKSVCNPCSIDCSVPGAIVPDPLDCTQYYVCLNGNKPLVTSCDTGEKFDYIANDCVPEDKANCYDFCNPCERYCTPNTKMQNPTNCHAYYYCDPPEQYADFECDPGYYFEPAEDTCVEGDDCTNACPNSTSSTTSPASGATTSSVSTTLTTSTAAPGPLDQEEMFVL